MSKSEQDGFRLGFLAAVEDAERGVVGGVLVTNKFGRPLEFQCTTPVKPNRTQQILYGPTLRAFLHSEVIGKTLIEKIGVKPHLVLVESAELLDLRQFVPMPVATLATAPMNDAAANERPGTGKRADRLFLGKQWLEFHPDFPDDQAVVQKGSGQVPETADLKEPFERIREALTETLKMALARPA
jgi:hypothetical protein